MGIVPEDNESTQDLKREVPSIVQCEAARSSCFALVSDTCLAALGARESSAAQPAQKCLGVVVLPRPAPLSPCFSRTLRPLV